MDISLLYFNGCPNHHDTRASLETLLDEAGWDGAIQSVNVDSPERAEALEFRGSPTVLINGDDPFLDTDESCSRQCTHNRPYAPLVGRTYVGYGWVGVRRFRP